MTQQARPLLMQYLHLSPAQKILFKWLHEKFMKINSENKTNFFKTRGQMWLQVLRAILFATLHPKTFWSYNIYTAKF